MNLSLKDYVEKRGNLLNLESFEEVIKVKDRFDTTDTRTKNKILNSINEVTKMKNKGELARECNTRLIFSTADLEDYCSAIKSNGVYALDLETTGFNPFSDKIVGVCLYTPNEDAVYIPFYHTDIYNNVLSGLIKEEVARDILKEIFSDGSIKTITHFGKFDYKFLKANWGVEITNKYFDTYIAAKLLNENEKNHKLKSLYETYCKEGDEKGKSFGDLFGDKTPFSYIPLEIAEIYGANDGYKTYKLYEFQSEYLNLEQKDASLRKLTKDTFFNIEMKLIDVVIDIELKGIKIDMEYAEKLNVDFKTEIDKMLKEMDTDMLKIKTEILENEELRRLTKDGKINYNSPKQLKLLFYEVLKLPKLNGKLAGSTSKVALKLLMSKSKKTEKFINTLLNYKKSKKLLSTYIEAIPLKTEKNWNTIHANFNQLGAKTGRFSSSGPNLQNIPSKNSEIRKMFKAREGYVLVSADYSQIEPRILASLSQDEQMIKAYENGRDLYAVMASKIFKKEYGECLEFDENGNYQAEGKKRRDATKSVLLGIMYERGSNAIAEQFNKSNKWAKGLVNDFLNNFKQIEKLRVKTVYQAEKWGYVNTIFNRKRRLPEMQLSKNNYKYTIAHRQCLNAVIQGSAGDIMKKAMISIHNDEELKKLDSQMLITVHDEVIVEIKEENVKEAVERLKKIMREEGEKATEINMKVDVEVFKKWYGEDLSDDYLN